MIAKRSCGRCLVGLNINIDTADNPDNPGYLDVVRFPDPPIPGPPIAIVANDGI